MNYNAEQYEKVLDKINNIVSASNDYKLMLQSICELLSSELKIGVVIKDSDNYYYNNKNTENCKDEHNTKDQIEIKKLNLGDENSGFITVEFWGEKYEPTAEQGNFEYKVIKISQDIFIRSLEVILNLIIKSFKDNKAEDEKKLREDVKNVLDKLSFSELNAVVKIFRNFNSDDETIVASKIAQKYDLTRSSIVNAIRKLESAMIIESYSLGVKGTHIKVINGYFIEEIKKLN